MSFHHNISIRNKLLFIVLLPLIGLAILTGMKVFELQEKTSRQSSLQELMDVSIAAGNLVHELQKERGVSAGFTSSNGANFADVLPQQRNHSDAKKEELMRILENVDTADFGKEYNKALQLALKDIEEIGAVRAKVDRFELPLAQVVGYYTHMNADFLALSNQAIFIAKDPDIIRDVSAYLNFLQSKERAGIERAVGAAGFGGGWNPQSLANFNTLIAVQDTYLDVFEVYATSEELQFYKEKTSDPVFAQVQKMREMAFSSAQATGPATTISAAEWFDTITRKINILKEIEDHLTKDVQMVAQSGADAAAFERNTYVLILGALIAAVLLMTIVILKDLLKSIRNTEEIMGTLAKGNTDVNIIGAERKDEIGGMARSIEVFKQGLIEKKQMEQEALKAQARAEEEKRKSMVALAADFDSHVGGMIDSLASASTELQSTAESMSDIAKQTSQSSQAVAASTEQSSTNVSTVASAMEEMAASSGEIASQIMGAKSKSNDTAENAEIANRTVGNLNELVENIGEVVTAIQDIAEQTNLLALNATIEAARAGEAGKGFAVVADEVKKLALETGNKTGEINSRITEIQEATRASVDAMGRIIANISEIDNSVTGVSAAVEEQNATTNEIVRSISEASQGVQQVAQIIVEVQRGAGETGSSAGAVLEASTEVAKLAESLKSSVNQFLNQIRGAGNTGEPAPVETLQAAE